VTEKRDTLLALSFVQMVNKFEDVRFAEFSEWESSAELPALLYSNRHAVSCEPFEGFYTRPVDGTLPPCERGNPIPQN
jgi:hypothetical protein